MEMEMEQAEIDSKVAIPVTLSRPPPTLCPYYYGGILV